jgi:hypothetical protein
MELVLNLVWIVLAGLMLCLWLRFGPQSGPDGRNHGRKMQFVALALLVLILFPVISVTDDLQAAQNPAETESSVRRNQAVASPHSTFPSVAALPLPLLAELSFGFSRFAPSRNLPAPMIDRPALDPIQNRPPPTA